MWFARLKVLAGQFPSSSDRAAREKVGPRFRDFGDFYSIT